MPVLLRLLSFSLSVCLSASLCLCFCLSVSLYVSESVCLPALLHFSLFVWLITVCFASFVFLCVCTGCLLVCHCFSLALVDCLRIIVSVLLVRCCNVVVFVCVCICFVCLSHCLPFCFVIVCLIALQPALSEVSAQGSFHWWPMKTKLQRSCIYLFVILSVCACLRCH